MSEWLAHEKFVVSKETVKSYCSIHVRVVAAHAEGVLEEIEEEFGMENQLVKTWILERLVQLTKADSEELQNSLLRWVLLDLRWAMRKKKIAEADARTVVVQQAKASLLSRRLLFCAVSKLRLQKSAAKELGFSTDDPFDFRTPFGFFSSFVSHENWDRSGLGNIASDTTWVAELPLYQQEALPYLQRFFEPTAKLMEALSEAVEKDPTGLTPEKALQHSRWTTLLPLAALLDARE